MIKNAEIFKIDVTAKTNIGQTGFQLAEMAGKQDVVNLIKETMPEIMY